MRDASATRARIVAQALRLFADKGVQGTAIREIAAAAGVAEGAIYRHFPGKDALARSIFLEGYAALAAEVNAAAAESAALEDIVAGVVGVFCRLFDADRALFSVLLLDQHAHLADVPQGRDANVVDAVSAVFSRAIREKDLPPGDPDMLSAFALGIVAQTAVFTLYGRLDGPLLPRAPAMANAVLAAARVGGYSAGRF